MSTPAPKPSEGQYALLRFLQREGKISGEDAARLQGSALEQGLSLSEVLEAEAIITEKDLAILLATTLRLRLIDLTSYPFDPQMSRELKEPVAIRYDVVPIRLEEHTIEVAIANPLDIGALKAIEFATGRRAVALVATRQEIRDALAHVYRLQESLDQFLQHVPDESVTLNELHDEGGDLRTIAREAELPPVVKLADLILIEGIKCRASDVHIEPGADAVAVRYRIDGILEESFRFPKWVQNPLIARLKVMAKLDITERRVPQDGRIQLRYGDRTVDLRVSSLPAQHGEKITLRILDATSGIKALDRLGFSAVDLQRMQDAIKKPEGLILITGPTGSGKTTTLYALLREKLSPNLNIVTIENPIEYQLKGINQVEVNEKQGLTFAGVLRSVLRQDPDVILIGEIRDKETAQIAMQAAQTGHLVLSTVHTNDATAAVTRLIDLGVEPFVVASTIHLIVAQRLVRRVCQSCSEPYAPSEDSRRLLRLDEAALTQIRHGKGCTACRQTGFAGRNGVYEVMPISPAMTKLIEANTTESTIRQQARTEGFPSIAEGAREKLLTGLTTPEEVLRVIQVNDYTPRCPGCEHEVDDDYSTCPHCGTSLRTLCSGCDKPLTAGWTACPYCGTKPAPVLAPGIMTAGSDGDGEDAVAPRRTYKALVVDDNAAIRDIVRLTLERSGLGLSVVIAEDGQRALELAEVERPDIVILDVQMPSMDGFEVCRRLRSDVRTAFVPVLLLTAQTDEESVAQGFAAGADDYVTKPFRRRDLLTRIRRMLERTYGKQAVASEDPSTPAPYVESARGGAFALADARGAAGVEMEAAAAGVEAYVRASPSSSPASVARETELNDVRRALERIRVEHEHALEQLRGEAKATAAALEEVQSALRDAALAQPRTDPVDAEHRAEMARREAALDAQIAALTPAPDLEDLRASVRAIEEAATAPNVEVGALMRAVERHENQLAALSDHIERDPGSRGTGGADASMASREELAALQTRTQEVGERVAAVDERLALVARETDCGALRDVVAQQTGRLDALAAQLEHIDTGALVALRARIDEMQAALAETSAASRRAASELIDARVESVQAAFEHARAAQAASTDATLDRVATDTAERLAATVGMVEQLRGNVERQVAERDATLEARFLGREADGGALREAVAQQKGRLDALAAQLEDRMSEARSELHNIVAAISRRTAEDAGGERTNAGALAAVHARIDEMQAALTETSAASRRAASELIDARVENVQAAFEHARAAQAASTEATLDRHAADTAERLTATLGMIEALRGEVERQVAEYDATLETRFLARGYEDEIATLRTRAHQLDERLAQVARQADSSALRDLVAQQTGRLDALADRLEREVGETGRMSAERAAEAMRDLAAARADLADVRRAVTELVTAQDGVMDEVRRELEKIAAETSATSRRTAVELIESRVESVQAAFERARAAQAVSTEAALDHLSADTTARLDATVEAFEALRAEVDRQVHSVRELLAAATNVDGFEVSVARLEKRQAADREVLITIVQKCEARLAELEGRIGSVDDLSMHVVEEVSGLASHLSALRDRVEVQQHDENELALRGAGAGWSAVEYAEIVFRRISDVSSAIGALLEYVRAPIAAAISSGAASGAAPAVHAEPPDARDAREGE